MSKDLVQFDELRADIAKLVAPVSSVLVTDFQSSAVAIDAAKQIKEYLNLVEYKRKELVEPHNRVVKQINEYAKTIVEPLRAAADHVQNQLRAFEMEQEKIRNEERKKAEAERQRLAAELFAKQETERQALYAQQEAAARAEAMFGAEEEKTPEQEDADLRAEEEALAIKQQQEQALAKAQAEAREYDIKRQGIKNARKTWKCELTDIKIVPKEFLITELNTAAVLAAARGGVTEIPGVKLWQETSIAIGSKTYVPREMLVKN